MARARDFALWCQNLVSIQAFRPYEGQMDASPFGIGCGSADSNWEDQPYEGQLSTIPTRSIYISTQSLCRQARGGAEPLQRSESNWPRALRAALAAMVAYVDRYFQHTQALSQLHIKSRRVGTRQECFF